MATRPTHKALIVEATGKNTYRYTDIGGVWDLPNGGFSVKLRANPLNGEFIIKPIDWDEIDKRKSEKEVEAPKKK